MNPEIQFKQYKADYSGMKLEEYTFTEMKNLYGENHYFKLDVMTSLVEENDIKPVALFIHGGGFTEPCDKRQAYIPLFARKLIEAGFAVVSPDYPVYKDESDRDQMTVNESADCCKEPASVVTKAVEYLCNHKQELKIDPNQIVILGGSAGGMTAFYTVAEGPDKYKAFINLWGTPAEFPDVSKFPPVLSVHGTADLLVPYEREKELTELLEEKGITNRLITLDGCGHTPLNRFDEFMPEIIDFLKECLK